MPPRKALYFIIALLLICGCRTSRIIVDVRCQVVHPIPVVVAGKVDITREP